MGLNATIFPDLDVPTLDVDFTRWVPTTMDRQAGAVMASYVEELDRRLEVTAWRDAGRRIVIAHSFGGMLALAWWLHHGGAGPSRIDGLVLIGTTAGPMFDVVQTRLFRLGTGDVRLPVTPFMGLWNTPALTRALHRLLGGRNEPERVDFRTLRHHGDLAVGLASWRGTDWRARRAHRLAMWGFDVRNQLRDVTVPTVVLHGSRDRLFTTDTAADLAHRLPGAEFRLIEDAGHLLPLTHGEEVQRAVQDFWD